MASSRKPKAEAASARRPLFYVQPEPLTVERHGDLALDRTEDFRFAAATNAVPITDVEFFEAMRAYPIVFAGEPVHPVCVLGLELDNLFVGDQGRWAAERYVPAYVRRYPFVFMESAGQFVLCVDAACGRLAPRAEAGPTALPLFLVGEPSPQTREALRFSAALQAQHAATRAFCEALVEQDLLVEQQASGALPNGRPFNVQGFRIIDGAKFQALPDAVVVDWHRKGWLALAQAHLLSLQRWRDLLDRQGAREAAAQPAEA
jgi:hypothetical protein